MEAQQAEELFVPELVARTSEAGMAANGNSAAAAAVAALAPPSPSSGSAPQLAPPGDSRDSFTPQPVSPEALPDSDDGRAGEEEALADIALNDVAVATAAPQPSRPPALTTSLLATGAPRLPLPDIGIHSPPPLRTPAASSGERRRADDREAADREAFGAEDGAATATGAEGDDITYEERAPDSPHGSTAASDESDKRMATMTGICNLKGGSALGGPGWFNDVFRVEVALGGGVTALDTPALAVIPSGDFRRRIRLFEATSDCVIAGTVEISAPPGRWVWCSGVEVALEEHLVVADGGIDDGGEVVGSVASRAKEGHWIRNCVSAKFSLATSALRRKRGWPLRDSYVGEVMALRHVLVVTVARPWYTFNVVRHVSLAFQHVEDPLPPRGRSIGRLNENGDPNHVLAVPDFSGSCEFDFGSDCLDIEGALEGTLRLSNISRRLTNVSLVLLKAEVAGGAVFESLLCEHVVVGKRRRPQRHPSAGSSREANAAMRGRQASPERGYNNGDNSPSGSPAGAAATALPTGRAHPRFVASRQEDPLPPQSLPLSEDLTEISVKLDLQQLAVTPTMASLSTDLEKVVNEEELISVRYFLRLVLEEAEGGAFWNTHEVYLYRSRLNPVELEASGAAATEDIDDDEDEEDSEEYSEAQVEVEEEVSDVTSDVIEATTGDAALEESGWWTGKRHSGSSRGGGGKGSTEARASGGKDGSGGAGMATCTEEQTPAATPAMNEMGTVDVPAAGGMDGRSGRGDGEKKSADRAGCNEEAA